MKDFWYFEPIFSSEHGSFTREKILLVKNDSDVLVAKYNLTKLGLENVNSFEEFNNYFAPLNHNIYNGNS